MTLQATADYDDTTAANRGGRMTAEQETRIRAEGPSAVLLMGVFMMLLGFTLCAWASGLRGLVDKRPDSGLLLPGGFFALVLFFISARIWRRFRLLQDVQAGQLERASGRVVWRAGAYRAEVPGHMLNLTGWNLAPGTYDFSFLPRSRRLVAVELAAADTPAQAQDELLHALAIANHFNIDDLLAYREGRLGRAGPRHLPRFWSTAGWFLLSAVLVLLVFVFYVNIDGIVTFVAKVIFVIGIVLGIGALASALVALNPTLDVLGGRVASAKGVVRKTLRQTTGRDATTYYYYTLGNQTWSVSPEAYRALIEGPQYRVNYLPRSKLLVGIEPSA
jgi:hypothetical protein